MLDLPPLTREEKDAYWLEKAAKDQAAFSQALAKSPLPPKPSAKTAPEAGAQAAELIQPGYTDAQEGQSPGVDVMSDHGMRKRMYDNLVAAKNDYVTNVFAAKAAELQKYGIITEVAGRGQDPHELNILNLSKDEDKDTVERITTFRTNINEYLKKGTLAEEYTKLVTSPFTNAQEVKLIGKQLEQALLIDVTRGSGNYEDVLKEFVPDASMTPDEVNRAFTQGDYDKIKGLMRKWYAKHQKAIEPSVVVKAFVEGAKQWGEWSMLEPQKNATMSPDDLLAKYSSRGLDIALGKGSVSEELAQDLEKVYGPQWKNKFAAFAGKYALIIGASAVATNAVVPAAVKAGAFSSMPGIPFLLKAPADTTLKIVSKAIYWGVESVMFRSLEEGFAAGLSPKEEAEAKVAYRDMWHNVYGDTMVALGMDALFSAAPKAVRLTGKVSNYLWNKAVSRVKGGAEHFGPAFHKSPLANLAEVSKSAVESQQMAKSADELAWGGFAPGSSLAKSAGDEDVGKFKGIMEALNETPSDNFPELSLLDEQMHGEMKGYGHGTNTGAFRAQVNEAAAGNPEFKQTDPFYTQYVVQKNKNGDYVYTMPFSGEKFTFGALTPAQAESVMGNGPVRGGVADFGESLGLVTPSQHSDLTHDIVGATRDLHNLARYELEVMNTNARAVFNKIKMSKRQEQDFFDALMRMDEKGEALPVGMLRGGYNWNDEMVAFWQNEWVPFQKKTKTLMDNFTVSQLRLGKKKVIDFNLDGHGQFGVVRRVSPEPKGDPGDFINTLYANEEIAQWVQRYEARTGIEKGSPDHALSQIAEGNKALVKVHDATDGAMPHIIDDEHIHLVDVNAIVEPTLQTPVVPYRPGHVPRVYKENYRHYVVEVNPPAAARSARLKNALPEGEVLPPEEISSANFLQDKVPPVKTHAATSDLRKAQRYIELNEDAAKKRGSHFVIVSPGKGREALGQSVPTGQLSDITSLTGGSLDDIVVGIQKSLGLTDTQTDLLFDGFSSVYMAPMLRHRKQEGLLEIVDHFGKARPAKVLTPKAAYMARLEQVAQAEGFVLPRQMVVAEYERLASDLIEDGYPKKWWAPLDSSKAKTLDDQRRLRSLRILNRWMQEHLFNAPTPLEARIISSLEDMERGISLLGNEEGRIAAIVNTLAPHLNPRKVSRALKSVTAGATYFMNLASTTVQFVPVATNSLARHMSINPLTGFGVPKMAKISAMTMDLALSYVPGATARTFGVGGKALDKVGKSIIPASIMPLRRMMDRSGFMHELTGLVDLEQFGPKGLNRVVFSTLFAGEGSARIIASASVYETMRDAYKISLKEVARGSKHPAHLQAVRWFERTGEATSEGRQYFATKAHDVFIDMRSENASRLGKGPVGVATQFIAQPAIKVAEQFYVGRGLTGGERIKFIIANAALWGVPALPFAGDSIDAVVAQYDAAKEGLKTPGSAQQKVDNLKQTLVDYVISDVRDPALRKEKSAQINTYINYLSSGLVGEGMFKSDADFNVIDRLFMGSILHDMSEMHGSSRFMLPAAFKKANQAFRSTKDALRILKDWYELTGDKGAYGNVWQSIDAGDRSKVEEDLKWHFALASTRSMGGVNRVLRTGMAVFPMWDKQRKWVDSHGRKIDKIENMKWGDWLALSTGIGDDVSKLMYDLKEASVADVDWMYSTVFSIVETGLTDPTKAQEMQAQAMEVAVNRSKFGLAERIPGLVNHFTIDKQEYLKQSVQWKAWSSAVRRKDLSNVDRIQSYGE